MNKNKAKLKFYPNRFDIIENGDYTVVCSDNFNLTENINWISWDNSGNILCTPNQNHIGEYELIFEISDGCFSLSATRTLVIE